MRVQVVDPTRPEASVIEGAAAILRAGGVVAFPTETVYGLGANALDEAAVRRIFEAKERPAYNPLIVHVGSRDAARNLVQEWPDSAGFLAARFWPGPLTLVLRKRARIPDLVTAGLDTVAVRVPHHPVALALLRTAALPVAAPSANRFTRLSPTTAEHVRQGLEGRVDLILDGGPSPVGIESTVVDLTGSVPRLLRPGTISRTALEAVVGPVEWSPGGEELDGEAARVSPGMVRKHYSPRAELLLFREDERPAMVRAALEAKAEGRRVGALLLRPLDTELDEPVIMPASPDEYARRLYSALHELDERQCSLIVADNVSDGAEWAGIGDRLSRAARSG